MIFLQLDLRSSDIEGVGGGGLHCNGGVCVLFTVPEGAVVWCVCVIGLHCNVKSGCVCILHYDLCDSSPL